MFRLSRYPSSGNQSSLACESVERCMGRQVTPISISLLIIPCNGILWYGINFFEVDFACCMKDRQTWRIENLITRAAGRMACGRIHCCPAGLGFATWLPFTCTHAVQLTCSVPNGTGSSGEQLLRKSDVYWTVHHCDKWRIKKQLDATCYIIVLLIGSTCFEHYYAHHHELATMLLITTLVVSFLVCCMFEVRCSEAEVVSVLQAQACNTDKPLHPKWQIVGFLFFSYWISFRISA